MPTKYRYSLLCALAVCLCALCGGSWAQDGKQTAAKDDPSVARMRKDIFFLASDDCEGRGVGTLGLDLAAQYIAVQFSQAGLKPGGVNGTYFQPFPFATGAKLDGVSTLVLEGPNDKKIELKQGVDFQVIGTSAPGKVDAPLVFVGYGVSWNGVAYDDYANVDVKGKIVVALRRLPRWSAKEKPFANADSMAVLDAKLHRAVGNQAAALILVNDASELPKDSLMPFQSRISTVQTPFVQMKRAALDEVLQASTGKGLLETEKAIDADLKPHSAPLKGWTARMDVKLTRKEVQVKNVIGYVDGSGPLADETIVVGSHYDHLGYGFGAPGPDKKKKIYYGADDNGSGTTSMMELARRFAARKDRQGRRMVFMAYTAEESGLIGSRHYTQVAPLFPLQKTSAMFNLDMVGRYDPRILTIDDKIVVVANGDSSRTTYELAEGCKVFRQTKGVREPIKEGLQAEDLKKIPAHGISALISTDAKNRAREITLLGAPPLMVEGFNTAKEFDALVTKLNPGFDIIKKNSRGFFSSDQYNYYVQNIPVVFFWTEVHPDYHQPTDTPDKINVAGMKKIADYAELVINDLRTNPKRPEYTPVNVKFAGGGTPPTIAPSLRFQPDPFFDGKGVLVDKIVSGGPADKAGVKEGDIIIEMAGKAIPNVATYNAVRATLKSGVEIDIKIVRDKKELTLKVTPVTLK